MPKQQKMQKWEKHFLKKHWKNYKNLMSLILKLTPDSNLVEDEIKIA